MLASVKELTRALGDPSPPAEITQEPLDLGSEHCRRLCREAGGADPKDLYGYAEDLTYREIQPDLLVFLLPICLTAWQEDLMAPHGSKYGAFREQLSTAMARNVGFRELLAPEQCAAVSDFMRDVILDKIDQESELSFSGSGASPYSWIEAIGTFGTAFPAVDELWRIWWSGSTPGRACGILQYASVLMYPDERNPIFAPWTGDAGGGPPCLWETDGHIHEESWLSENVDFLRGTFTVRFVREGIHAAASMLRVKTASTIPKQMAADLQEAETLVELRLAELVENLSRPLGEIRTWRAT